jgi:hypothetical protein
MAQHQAGNLTQRRASQRPLAAGTPLRNPVSWEEASPTVTRNGQGPAVPRAGSPLPEVGQVLRHRSPLTTAIGRREVSLGRKRPGR